MTTSEPKAEAASAEPAAFLVYLATVVVVLPLGAAVGLAASVNAGWLTRYWAAGQLVPTIAVLGLLLYLALLYTGVRLLAWGSGRPSAAAVFAGGYVLSLVAVVGHVPGGDVLLSGHLVHYGFLFGSMLALALAVVRSGLSPSVEGPTPSL